MSIFYILIAFESLQVALGCIPPSNIKDFSNTKNENENEFNEASNELSITSVLTENRTCSYGYVLDGSECIECGLSDFHRNTRIIGGKQAVQHSWPSLVLLIRHYKTKKNQPIPSVCAGILITRNVVLTAAHCLFSTFPFDNKKVDYVPNVFHPNIESTYFVVAGLYNMSSLNSNRSVKLNVSKVILHPGYNHKTNLNDIGLLILKEKVTLSPYIKIACLPKEQSNSYPSMFTEAWVAGWGKSDDNTPLQQNLLNVKMSIYHPIFCSNMGFQFIKKWDSLICAGDIISKKSACRGDSGGGLYISGDTIDGKTRYVAAGIVSYGACGRFSMFVRTSYYLDWINETIKKH